MPIIGMTDQRELLAENRVGLEADPRGRPVRLGYLQKGYREGFGKRIKLHDLDHFRFKPLDEGEAGDEMIRLFKEIYGERPQVIPDVRIPVSLAGNFNIENCATMLAMRYTERGSIFLAAGDGKHVHKLRDEETGDILRIGRGLKAPIPIDEVSRPDEKGNPCLLYQGNLYPWQASMAVDLILPDFNEALYKAHLAGYGVVTFITHSNNDIPNLCAEFRQIMDEIVGLLSNPMDHHSVQRARNYTPLRDVPIRLYRRNDKVTTPDYRDNSRPGDRLLSTRWLCHWEIAPEFAQAIHIARQQRTQNLLRAVAEAPLLTAGQPSRIDLLRDEPLAIPAETNGNGHEVKPEPADVDWEEIIEHEPVEAVEGEIVENAEDDTPPWEEPEPPAEQELPEPMDWQAEALEARNLDDLAYNLYQLHKDWFDDAPQMRRAIEHIAGGYDADADRLVLTVAAIGRLVNSRADGALWKDATPAVKAWFEKQAAALKPKTRKAKKVKQAALLPDEDTTYQEG